VWFVLAYIELLRVRRGYTQAGFRLGIPDLLRLPPHAVGNTDDAAVEIVCGAIDRAIAWLPRAPLCLPRSIATTRLLRRCGVPAVMVIGVRRIPAGGHAWVEVCGRIVNDEIEACAPYTPLVPSATL
jgi:hypothetical protein